MVVMLLVGLGLTLVCCGGGVGCKVVVVERVVMLDVELGLTVVCCGGVGCKVVVV